MNDLLQCQLVQYKFVLFGMISQFRQIIHQLTRPLRLQPRAFERRPIFREIASLGLSLIRYTHF